MTGPRPGHRIDWRMHGGHVAQATVLSTQMQQDGTALIRVLPPEGAVQQGDVDPQARTDGRTAD